MSHTKSNEFTKADKPCLAIDAFFRIVIEKTMKTRQNCDSFKPFIWQSLLMEEFMGHGAPRSPKGQQTFKFQFSHPGLVRDGV